MKPYVVYKSSGKLWKAGKGVFGLCSAYNYATNPTKPMTDQEHKRSFVYARAIMNRMIRIGFKHEIHYRELSNGALWPLKSLM
jgi:hypothetical protein